MYFLNKVSLVIMYKNSTGKKKWTRDTNILTYLDVKLAALMLKKVELDSFATALAWKKRIELSHML